MSFLISQNVTEGEKQSPVELPWDKCLFFSAIFRFKKVTFLFLAFDICAQMVACVAARRRQSKSLGCIRFSIGLE